MPKELSFRDVVNKEYQKADIPMENLILFRNEIRYLFDNLNIAESEEHNKKLLIDCLKHSLYPHNAINSESKTDFVIYADENSKDSHPVVLVETKRVDSDEMITPSNMNKKGLHQIILYYLRQELAHNVAIKHLIVTNFHDIYIFDKMNFLRLFATSKSFRNDVESADKQKYHTDYIYKNFIANKVDEVIDRLEYIHVDLKRLYEAIKKDEEKVLKNKEFVKAYKILSSIHLLKQRYGYNHNKLNQAFYDELLFIMGLEEKKDVNNKNILKIVRKEKNNRQFYSLLEQAIFKIKEKELLTDENELFEKALGLVIVWINRILFIKLLESQLREYVGNDDIRILDSSIIKSYSDLNALFFHVLAHRQKERAPELDKFREVPYLNSSLFEESEMETNTRMTIDNLMLGSMNTYEKTKVRDADGKIVRKEDTLNYLLAFLNSYDFGSYSKEKDADNLINAAVLGLIFEKINGYKDGAYFTPSYITEYMSKEAIRMAVVDLFNKNLGRKEYSDFEDLKNNLPHRKQEDIAYANSIVNSIKICDPSVGSGHFLVSALNELIALKSELRILHEHTDDVRPLEWEVRIMNDELDIRNGYELPYQYDPSSAASKRVQMAIFEEKRELIENCLFGVDINPKSVDICKLRLWIELLKNSYYIIENGKNILVTLPNIDTNIKCGNSLISHRPVRVGASYSDSENAISLINEYKNNVREYKNDNNKKSKAKLSLSISNIKEQLKKSVQQDLFGNIDKVETDEQKMYYHSFEWLLEFPEVLDENGNFEGFDVVIGNPPYISLQTMKEASKVYGKTLTTKYGESKKRFEIYEAKGDIYSLFIERATYILKPNGLLCFITSNKWMNTDYGRTTQRYLSQHTNPVRLIDFPGIKLFDKATVETNIILCSLSDNKDCTLSVSIDKSRKGELRNLWDFVHQNSMVCHFANAEGWRIESEMDLAIMGKVRKGGIAIKQLDDITLNFGVKTGNNDAFLVSESVRNDILADCQSEDERIRTEELIRPIYRGSDLGIYMTVSANDWLIATFPSRKYDIEEYPAVKKFLLSYAKKALCERGDSWIAEDYLEEYCFKKLCQDHSVITINGQQIVDANGNKEISRKKSSNKWFETQDNIAYWEEFAKPKILWKRIGDKLRTTYDDTGAYGLDSTCMATGKYVSFLCCLFNSHLGHYLLSRGQRTGTGDLLVSCQAVEPILVPAEGIEIEKFENWLSAQRDSYSEVVQNEIDREIFRIYGFDMENDRDIIEYICSKGNIFKLK